MRYSVTKQFVRHTHYSGAKFEIGPFDTFRRARKECKEWMDADCERIGLGAERYRKAPQSSGAPYRVDMGDAMYWIEKVTP